MTLETLKQLIEVEFDRCETISQFKSEVFRLIDLYEKDKQPFTPTPGFIIDPLYKPWNIEEGKPIQSGFKIDYGTYYDKCPCNPKNGGSGVCGCVMGDRTTCKS